MIPYVLLSLVRCPNVVDINPLSSPDGIVLEESDDMIAGRRYDIVLQFVQCYLRGTRSHA